MIEIVSPDLLRSIHTSQDFVDNVRNASRETVTDYRERYFFEVDPNEFI